MKRYFLILLACMGAMAGMAQSAAAALDKCAAAINAAGGVTANYSIKSSQGASKGTISMQGNKFRISGSDTKCWFDGKTQWSWSPVTGEVNITTPTAEELQMTNPIAAVQHFKSAFNIKKAKAKTSNTLALKLTPKKKDNIKTLWLYFDASTSLLRTARFEMSDKTVYVVQLTGYKHKSLPASTFTFDKSQVPAGTQVIDLR